MLGIGIEKYHLIWTLTLRTKDSWKEYYQTVWKLSLYASYLICKNSEKVLFTKQKKKYCLVPNGVVVNALFLIEYKSFLWCFKKVTNVFICQNLVSRNIYFNTNESFKEPKISKLGILQEISTNMRDGFYSLRQFLTNYFKTNLQNWVMREFYE